MDLLAAIPSQDAAAATSGTLTKLLQNGVQVEDDDDDFNLTPREKGQQQLLFDKNNLEVDDNGEYLVPQAQIINGRRMPTLYEVMEDDDFIAELKLNNELLIKFLDKNRLNQMIKLTTEEPKFSDSPQRCFKLPFVAMQAFSMDNAYILSQIFDDPNNELLNTLMEFITVPEEIQLNSTLCGYFNKILSFWFIKKPNEIVRFLEQHPSALNDMVEHIYLNSSIIDAIIRICCIQSLGEEEQEFLNNIRQELLQNTINKLEHYQDDIYMTEQIFCILSGLLKKCYVMINPRQFFEEMLSPFAMKQILDYTFQIEFGQHTSIGADFLTLMLYNLFISEPNDAIQDVLEVNFGFQVTQIAGVDVEQKDEENKEEKEEKTDEKPAGEFTAMQQEERAKTALMKDKTRIFERGPLDSIIASQLCDEIGNFENLLCQPILPTIIKTKLYELLSSLIQVGDEMIFEAIYNSKIMNFIVIDYDKYENNSNILLLLNGVVKSMILVDSEFSLSDKILFDLKLLEHFAAKIDHPDNKVSQAQKKDIYPFIHNLTLYLQEIIQQKPKLMAQIQGRQFWQTLVQAVYESQLIISTQWGDRQIQHDAAKIQRKPDIVRRHDVQGSDNLTTLNQHGAAGTTKKIIKKSLTARVKLAAMDDVLN